MDEQNITQQYLTAWNNHDADALCNEWLYLPRAFEPTFNSKAIDLTHRSPYHQVV